MSNSNDGEPICNNVESSSDKLNFEAKLTDGQCTSTTCQPWLTSVVSSVPCPTKDDLFLCAIFVLAHEAGFIAVAEGQTTPTVGFIPSGRFDVRRLRSLTGILGVVRDGNCCKIDLFVPNINDNFVANLILIPKLTFHLIIINMHVAGIQCFSRSYSLDRFVISADPPVFSNLEELAISFKTICHHTYNCLLSLAGCQSYSFIEFPYEVLYHIATFLDISSFVKLVSTCKMLRSTLYNDEHLWKNIFLRRMHSCHSQTDVGDKNVSNYWRKLSIEKYRNCCTNRVNTGYQNSNVDFLYQYYFP